MSERKVVRLQPFDGISRRRPDSETLTKSSSESHVRLVLSRGNLDEFRCGGCGHLLFKGLNLEKSMIEVKCPSCKSMLVSGEPTVVQ